LIIGELMRELLSLSSMVLTSFGFYNVLKVGNQA
jgi:hypothetical protein